MLSLVLILVLVGVCLYLFNNYVPAPASFKNILNVVVIIFVAFWLLSVFGILGTSIAPLHFHHLHLLNR
jgi:ABC-type siderophore export system fused ATPase/permease subunit